MFFLLYRHTDNGVIDDFPKISEDSPKFAISEIIDILTSEDMKNTSRM